MYLCKGNTDKGCCGIILGLTTLVVIEHEVLMVISAILNVVNSADGLNSLFVF